MSLIRRLIMYTLGTRCTRATSARGAVGRLRASDRSTRSARRHKGTEGFKNWLAHISATFRLVSLCGPRLGSVRNGRDALVASVCGTQMLRMRRFGKDRCGYDARNTGLRHNRSLPRCRAGIDGPVHLASTINPIISRPSPVGEAARKPTSKPISVSPSLRVLRVDRPEATRCTRAASARGAGRRPRASGICIAPHLFVRRDSRTSVAPCTPSLPIDAAMKYYDKTQFGRDRTPGDPQRFYNVNSLVWRCGAAGVRALPVLTAHDISLPEQ